MSDENDRDASSTRPMKSFRGRVYVTVLFFPYHGFYPNGFFHDKVFNKAVRNSTVMDTQGGVLKIDKTLCDYPSQLVLQVNQRLSSYPNTTSSPSNSTIYTLVCSFVNNIIIYDIQHKQPIQHFGILVDEQDKWIMKFPSTPFHSISSFNIEG